MAKSFKLLYIFLCILTTLTMVVGINVINAAEPLTITMESKSASPGDVVDLRIIVSNNPGFNALTVGIVYPDGVSQANIVNNASDLFFTKGTTNVWDTAENYKGNGSLATVSVKIADDAIPGTYTIHLLNCMAANENFSAVSVTVVEAVITVTCPHKNTESRPAVSATCQNSGTEKGVYCYDCQTYISGGGFIPATGVHTDADGKWETSDTYHWYTCSCGEKEDYGKHVFDDSDDMICNTCKYDRACKHIKPLEYVAENPNTCTENGNKEYWLCNECRAVFKADSATSENEISASDVILVALGHSESLVYSADGAYHWKVCSRVKCGAVIESTKGMHNGVATCENKPICSICNKIYGESLGHSLSKEYFPSGDQGHARKCTNFGCDYHEKLQPHDNDGKLCEACGFIYHVCGENMTFVPSVIGNCVVRGRRAYYKCSCNKFYFDKDAQSIINSLAEIETSYGAHNEVMIPAVGATCTADGATESFICTLCKAEITASLVIPATGHIWGEWIITLDPTEFANGSKNRKCSACNEVEIATIPTLGHEHSAVEIPGVKPTCTTTGLTAGSKCAVCGEIIVAQEIIPANSHISVDHVAAKAATSTESGNIEYWCCRDCGVLWLDAGLTKFAKTEDVIVSAIPETEPEVTTAVPEETTLLPEETTVIHEETTTATVPASGDDSVFLIASLIIISAILVIAISIRKKRMNN